MALKLGGTAKAIADANKKREEEEKKAKESKNTWDGMKAAAQEKAASNDFKRWVISSNARTSSTDTANRALGAEQSTKPKVTYTGQKKNDERMDVGVAKQGIQSWNLSIEKKKANPWDEYMEKNYGAKKKIDQAITSRSTLKEQADQTAKANELRNLYRNGADMPETAGPVAKRHLSGDDLKDMALKNGASLQHGRQTSKVTYRGMTEEEAEKRRAATEQHNRDVQDGLAGQNAVRGGGTAKYLNRASHNTQDGREAAIAIFDMLEGEMVTGVSDDEKERIGRELANRANYDARLRGQLDDAIWNQAQARERIYQENYGDPTARQKQMQEQMQAWQHGNIEQVKQDERQIYQTNPLFAVQTHNEMIRSLDDEERYYQAMQEDMERYPDAWDQWEKDMVHDRLLVIRQDKASLGDVAREWDPDYERKSVPMEGVHDTTYAIINGADPEQAYKEYEEQRKSPEQEAIWQRADALQERLNEQRPEDEENRAAMEAELEELKKQIYPPYNDSPTAMLDEVIFSSQMSEQDRKTYNVIYREEGRDAANEFLQRTKNKWYEGWTQEELKELDGYLRKSGWNVVAENLKNVFRGMDDPLTLLRMTMKSMDGELISAYDPAFMNTRKKGYTQATTIEQIQNSNFKVDVFDEDTPEGKQLNEQYSNGLKNAAVFMYQAASSGADQYGTFWTDILLGPGNLLGLAIMGGHSGMNALMESLEKGGASRAAAARGVVNCVCEIAMERLGMERVVDMFTAGTLSREGAFRQLAKGILSEAGEEVPGDIIDREMDAWYNKDNSDRSNQIRATVEQMRAQAAMTRQPFDEAAAIREAENRVDYAFAQQVATGALMAGVSAGVAMGGSYIVGRVTGNYQQNKYEKNIINRAVEIEREYQQKYGAETAEAVRTLAQEETTEAGRVAALTTAANAVLAEKRGPINPEIAEIILKNDHPDGMKTDELNDWRQTFTNVLNDSQRVRQAEEIRKQRNQGRQQRAGERVEAEKAQAAELNEEETRPSQPADAGSSPRGGAETETPTPRTTPEERRAEAERLNEQETVRPAAETSSATAEAAAPSPEGKAETAPAPRTTPAERRAEAERLNEFETRRAELNEELEQLGRDYNDANNVRDMTRVRERQEEVRRQLQELDIQEHAYNQTRTFNGLDADNINRASEQRTTPEERRAELERLNEQETVRPTAEETPAQEAPTPRTTPAERRAEAEKLNEQETRQEPVTQADVMEAIQEESEENDRRTVFAAPATTGAGEAVQITGIVATKSNKDGGAKVEITGADGTVRTVALKDVRFGRAWQQAAYDIATDLRDVEAARAFLAVAEQESMPLETVKRDFARYYQYGRNRNENMLNVAGKAISDAAAHAAYEAGVKSLTSENERVNIPKEVDAAVRKDLERIAKEKPWNQKGYRGVQFGTDVKRLTPGQAVQAYILDKIGKRNGTVYVLTDLNSSRDTSREGQVAGAYQGGNVALIDINAEGGILRAAGHETWHEMVEWASTQDDEGKTTEALRKVQQAVFDALEKTGWDLDARVEEKKNEYREKLGQELTDEEARDELMADALPEIFTQDASELMHTLDNIEEPETKKTILEKLCDIVGRVMDYFKQLAGRIAGRNPEVRAALEADTQAMQNAYDTLRDMQEQMGQDEGWSERTGEGGTRYAAESATTVDVTEKGIVDRNLRNAEAMRAAMDSWNDGSEMSFENVQKLLGSSMTKSVEQILHNTFQKGEHRKDKTEAIIRKQDVLNAIERDIEYTRAHAATVAKGLASIANNDVEVVGAAENTLKTDSKSLTEKKKKARKIFDHDIGQITVTNKDTEVTMVIGMRVFDETWAHNDFRTVNAEKLFQVLMKTPEIAEKAAYIGQHPDYSVKNTDMYLYVAPVKFENDQTAVVLLEAKIDKTGRADESLYIERISFMENETVPDADATGGPVQENEEHRNELRNSPPDTGTIKVSRLLEYVNTEQIKNFDKEGQKNKTLSFSLVDIDEHDSETERLIRENEELRQMLEATETVADVLKKHVDGLPSKPRAVAIDKLVDKIKNDTGTKVSKKNLRENLTRAFTVMANAQSDADVQMAYEMLGDIAADAIDKADYKYDPLNEIGYGEEARTELENMLRRASTSDWQALSEIVGTTDTRVLRRYVQDTTGVSIGDSVSYRKNSKGEMEWQGGKKYEEHKHQKGIDSDYQAFARRFPGIVDPDVAEEDQIGEVMRALDHFRPVLVNAYEADVTGGYPGGAKEAKRNLTLELFDAYMNDDSMWKGMTGQDATRMMQYQRELQDHLETITDEWQRTEKAYNQAMDKLDKVQRQRNAAYEKLNKTQKERDLAQYYWQKWQTRQERTVEMLKNARKEQERIAQTWSDKVKAQAWARTENDAYNKLRGHVVAQKQQIQRKLEDPNNRRGFIPDELRDVMEKLVKAIDYDGTFIPEGQTAPERDAAGRALMDRDLMAAVKDAYIQLKDQKNAMGTAYYDDDMVVVLDRLIASLMRSHEEKAEQRGFKGNKDYRLKKSERLTIEEMRDLDYVVSGLNAVVKNANQAFTDAKGRRIEEIGEAALEQVDRFVETHGEKKTGTRITEWLNAGLKNGMMKPVTYFDMMRDTEFNRLFYEGDRSLRNAEGTQVRLMQGAEEKLNELLDKYHMRDSFNRSGAETQKKRREKAVEITLKTGEKLRITDQEAMSIYATYKREKDGVTNHLLTGGIMLADRDRNTTNKPMVLFLDDINAIIDTLTDEQKGFVDEAVGYLSTEVAEWGNEITRQLYGVDKFTEKYYFPFEVVKSTVEAKVAEAQDQRIKVGSQTKALTVGANNALNIRGFTEVWCQHVEKMADYNAFVLPIEDMTRLLNYQHIIRNDDGDIIGRGRNIKTEMEAAYGKEAVQYLVRFLSTLNGNAAHEHGNSWLNSFTSKAKGAAVGGNLSVVLQQAGAGVRAMAEINPGHVLKGIGKVNPLRVNQIWEEVQKYAWIAVEKDWGYLDTQQTGNLASRNRTTLMSRINDATGAAAGFMDKLNWTQIWEAVKSEQAAAHKDMDPKSEAFLQLCGQRFTEVIDKTQVIDSVFQRSAWAMEKGRMANFMAFMNEPIAQYNMLLRGVMRMQEAARMPKGEARTKAMQEGAVMLTRNSMAIVVSAMLTSALAAIARGLRDKEDKKYETYIDENGNQKKRIVGRRNLKDKILAQWWPGVLDSLTSLGGVYADIAKGIFTGEEISNDMSMTWVTSAGYLVRNLVKLAQGGTADPERTAYYGMQVVSNLTGVPLSNVYRDVYSIARTVREELITAGTTEGDAWDISLSMEKRLAAAQNSYVYNKAAKTGEAANRKVNTEIWTALMMTEYKEHGESAMFTRIVNAAQKAGASADAMLNKFKAEFPKINPLVDKAAQALNREDFTTYDKTVKELETKYRLGSKTVNAMVRTAYNNLQEKTETKSTKDFSKELHADQGTTATIGETVAKDALAKALASGTEKQIKDAVAQAKKQGRTDNEIQTQVRQAYQKDFVDALVSGNKAKAQGIVKKILASGAYDEAGIAEKTLDWVKSENSSGLYESIKRGDSRQAAKVYSWMCQTYGSSTMTKSIASWLRTNASEYEDNVRTCLRAMGYGAASIDKIVKDSYASKKKTPKTNKTNKTKTTKAWE